MTLVELANIVEIFDGPHATPKRAENGPIFLGISNLTEGRLELSDLRRLSESDFQKWTRRVTPREGDLVFSYETKLGAAALIPAGIRCCLGRRMGLLRPLDPKAIDPQYLLYAYIAPDFQEVIRQRTVYGSTVNRIALTEMGSFPIKVPPLPEQKRIAAVLGALDDKIENNRKMNETLEAMAQAIFKSWFVDFDPVIDNALRAGNPIPEDLEPKAQRRREAMARDSYKIPPYAHLFPNHFVDSRFGSIPGNWKIEKLQKLSDLTWGDTNTTKKSYVESGFPAYSAKGEDGYLPHFDYERTGVVISAIGANCGTTWLALGKWSCIKNTIRFWSVDPNIPTEFLYHATFGQAFWPRRGSAQPFISQTDARNCKILIPSDSSADVFGVTVRTFYNKIDSNQKESQTLASLRDTLLPKLISGELRVPEIEGLVEAHV